MPITLLIVPIAEGLRSLLFAMLAVGLLGCGGGSGASAPVDPSGPQTVAPGTWVVLGSSTAAGVGASPGQGWVALLAAQVATVGVLIENRGVSGATTYQALPATQTRPSIRPATTQNLDIDAALLTSPRLVIFAFPNNDALSGYTAAETVANLGLLRERARSRGATVILLSSQPRNDASAAQRAVMSEVDQAMRLLAGACFVDVAAALTAPSGGIASPFATSDGVHLSDAGHRLIVDAVSARLYGGQCVKLSG